MQTTSQKAGIQTLVISLIIQVPSLWLLCSTVFNNLQNQSNHDVNYLSYVLGFIGAIGGGIYLLAKSEHMLDLVKSNFMVRVVFGFQVFAGTAIGAVLTAGIGYFLVDEVLHASSVFLRYIQIIFATLIFGTLTIVLAFFAITSLGVAFSIVSADWTFGAKEKPQALDQEKDRRQQTDPGDNQ